MIRSGVTPAIPEAPPTLEAFVAVARLRQAIEEAEEPGLARNVRADRLALARELVLSARKDLYATLGQVQGLLEATRIGI